MLTPQEADSLFETLRTMADEGRTVIFISHKLHEVKAVSDNVTVLRAGKTVATVSTAESTPHSLAELMVGRELDASGRERRVCVPGARALELEDVWVAGDRGDDAVRGVTLQRLRRRDRRRGGRRRQRPARARRGRRRDAARLARAGARRAASRCAEATRASRSAPVSPTCRRTACTRASRRASASARTSCSRRTATASSRPGRCSAWARSANGLSSLIKHYDVRGGEPQLPARLLSGGNLQKVVLGQGVLGLAARARRRLADARARRVGDRDGALLPAQRRGRRHGDPADQRGPRRDHGARRPHRRHVRGRHRGRARRGDARPSSSSAC